MVKATVVGCRTLSIRKDPCSDDSELYEEIASEVPSGTILNVNPNKIVYDWKGNAYHPVKTSGGIEGYAIVGALEYS